MPKRTKDYHSWLLKRLFEPREAERYLKVAMADSPEIFLKALRNVAEANRMSKVAENAGVNRESLYKALSTEGNPRLSTLDSVLAALGMELTVRLKETVPSRSKPSPESTEFGESAPVRIKSNIENMLGSIDWTLGPPTTGIFGEYSNHQDAQNAAMGELLPAYVIERIAGNIPLQEQLAGGQD
jgi:probable addiction module antidote protein